MQSANHVSGSPGSHPSTSVMKADVAKQSENGIRQISFSEFVASLMKKSEAGHPSGVSIATVLQDRQHSAPSTSKTKNRLIANKTPSAHKEDYFAEKAQQSHIGAYVPSPKVLSSSTDSHHELAKSATVDEDDVENSTTCKSFNLNLVDDIIVTEESSFRIHPVKDVDDYVGLLSEEYSYFPVQQCLTDLKKSSTEGSVNLDSKSLLWTDKYAPSSCSTLLYNGRSFDRLRRWLERWKSLTDSSAKSKGSKTPSRAQNCQRTYAQHVNSGGGQDDVIHVDDDDDNGAFFLHDPAPKRRRTSRNSNISMRPVAPVELSLSAHNPRLPLGWKRANTKQMGLECASESELSDPMSDSSVSGGACGYDSYDEDSRSSSSRSPPVPEWRSKAYMLLGPSGIGKSSMVYALANDLGFKVFELNPSVRRSGKDLSDQFQVALDSHHVAKEHLTPSFSTFHMTKSANPPIGQGALLKTRKSATAANFFQPRTKSVGTGKKKAGMMKEVPKHTGAKGLNLSCNSLVLLDEVDVLFESDRGFWNGLDNLLQLRRRPIILTASDPSIVHNLPVSARVCLVKPPDQALVIPYLRLVCLAEGYSLDATEAKRVCQTVQRQQHNSRFDSPESPRSHLDVRRVLNSLQWHALTISTSSDSPSSASTSCVNFAEEHGVVDQLPYLCPLLSSLSVQGQVTATPPNPVVSETSKGCPDTTSLDMVFDDEREPAENAANSKPPEPPVQSVQIPSQIAAKLCAKTMDDLQRACLRWSDLELCNASFTRARLLHLLNAPEETTDSGPRGGSSKDLSPSGSSNRIFSSTCGIRGMSTIGVNPLMTNLTASLVPFELSYEALFEQAWPALLSHWTTHRLTQCEKAAQSELGTSSSQSISPAARSSHLSSCCNPSHSSRKTKKLASELSARGLGGPSFKSFSRCGRDALALDYLPCLRTFASGEATKQVLSNKRRFFHYFDRINLHLSASTRQTLSKPVFLT